MVAGNLITENSRVKNDGTHQATEFSLMSFKLEDEPDARKVKKNERMAMLSCHVLKMRKWAIAVFQLATVHLGISSQLVSAVNVLDEKCIGSYSRQFK